MPTPPEAPTFPVALTIPDDVVDQRPAEEKAVLSRQPGLLNTEAIATLDVECRRSVQRSLKSRDQMSMAAEIARDVVGSTTAQNHHARRRPGRCRFGQRRYRRLQRAVAADQDQGLGLRPDRIMHGRVDFLQIAHARRGHAAIPGQCLDLAPALAQGRAKAARVEDHRRFRCRVGVSQAQRK